MSIGTDTLISPPPLLVLYADISGSTRLYEEFGDEIARQSTAACIEVLCEVVKRHGGRVLKLIGDEVMAAFADPSRGVMAATDMQGAVKKAGEEGRFVTGPLRIKVGMHFGLAAEENGDLFGEAPTLAQAVINLAKPDQVLATADTLDAVPQMLTANSRFVDDLPAGTDWPAAEIHELCWEVDELTAQISIGAQRAARETSGALHLRYGGESWRLEAGRAPLTIGRTAGNDVVVPTDLTSREHARIESRKGRFVLADNSANGTLLIAEDGAITVLHRDHAPLKGCGRICFGGTPDGNPDGLVDFRLE